MTYEDFLRLQGQQPGFGFGTLGADQTTPSPVPPITEVPAPNISQMPGQGLDWRKLAMNEAQRMLTQESPQENMSPMMPLGMALMSLGQQMQVPPALRGQNNNLQSMANSLLAWQMNQQKQGERQDLRRSQAIELLGKATEPDWMQKAAATYGLARQAKAEDVPIEAAKAEAVEKAKRKYMPVQLEKITQGEQEVAYERDPVTGVRTEIGRGPKFQEEAIMFDKSGRPVIVKGGKGITANTMVGMEPTTGGKIEQQVMQHHAALQSINEIQKNFDPRFLSYEGQFKGGWTALKDKFNAGSVSPQDQQYLGNYSAFRASSGQMLADRLKEMSGTAVTEPEMKRQEVYMPKAGTGIFDGDSPTQFKSKLDRFQKFTENAISRLQYLRHNGFVINNADDLNKAISTTGTNLDNMPNIKKQELIKLKNAGVPPDKAKQIYQQMFGVIP